MENVQEDLAFEEAFAELQATIDELRGETLTLERSLALYERGTALAAHCNALLTSAELRVTQLDAVSSRTADDEEVESDW